MKHTILLFSLTICNFFFAQINDKDFLLQYSIDIQPNSIPFNKKGKWGVASLDGTILIRPQYDSLLNAGKNLCIVYTEKKGYQILTSESRELLSTTAGRIRFLESGIFEITQKDNVVTYAIWNGETLQTSNDKATIDLIKSKNDYWNNQVINSNQAGLDKYVLSINIFEDSGLKFFNCKLKSGVKLRLDNLSTVKFISPFYIQGFDKIKGIGYLIDLSSGLTYSVENGLIESPLKRNKDLFFIKHTNAGYNLIKNNVPTSYLSQDPLELKNGLIIKTIKNMNFNSSSIKLYNIDDHQPIAGIFNLTLQHGSVLAVYSQKNNLTLYSKNGDLIKTIANMDVITCENYEIDSLPIIKVVSSKPLNEAPIKLNDIIKKELPSKSNHSEESAIARDYFEPRFESILSISGKVFLEVNGSITPYSINSPFFQINQMNGESFFYYIDIQRDTAIQLNYDYLSPLSDSLCIVKNDNQYSLLQLYNQDLKPILFDNVLIQGMGEHKVVICTNEGKTFYFDEKMKPLYFDQDVNITSLTSDYPTTEPYYLKYSNKEKLVGVLDSEGKILIQANYKSILYRKRGNYFVCLLPNSKLEYFLPSGKQLYVE